MRALSLFLLVTVLAFAQESPPSRPAFALEQRLNLPLRISGGPATLVDFVSFIATTYKVPLLVETASPVPSLHVPAGNFTARQLLDRAVRQLAGFEWRDKAGVAHLYQKRLMRSRGNLLNVIIPRYRVPSNVGDFLYFFPACILSTIRGYGCESGAFSGFILPELKREQLPLLPVFEKMGSRDILLRVLQVNGRFFVLIAFDGIEPQLDNQFPFQNWFSRSLISDDVAPIWVQNPRKQ